MYILPILFVWLSIEYQLEFQFSFFSSGVSDQKKLEPAPPPNLDNKIPQADLNNGNQLLAGDKRIEPPIPVAPEKKAVVADTKVEPNAVPPAPAKIAEVPLETNDENKRVEPPVPVAPDAIKAAANVDAAPPSPEAAKLEKIATKDEAKNALPIDGNAPNAKQPARVPSPKKARKVQKAAPEKTAPQNGEKVAMEPKSPEPPAAGKADNAGAAMPPDTNLRKPDDPNDPPKQVQEKPPLPILMNAKSTKENANDNAAQRDILQNVEREKRDLNFVNETLRAAKDVKAVEEPIGPGDADRNAFVEKVANAANDEQCEKNDAPPGTSADSEVKGRNRNEIPPLGYDGNGHEPSPHQEAAKIELNEKRAGQTSSDLVAKPGPAKSVPDTVKNDRSSIILAPAKLSDPVVTLDEKLPADNLLESHVPSSLKMLTRDLKTVDKNDDNRKK